MNNFLNYVHSFIQKAVWVISLILISVTSYKPVIVIINDPDTFSTGNFYCLYYLVWILTSVLGFYFIAKIISNILMVSEPVFLSKKEDLKHEDEKDH